MPPQVVMTMRKPDITLDLILLMVINIVLLPSLDPKINFRASVWVQSRSRQCAPGWLTNQGPSLFGKSRLEPPRAGSGPRKLRALPLLASTFEISLPRNPAYTGTQNLPPHSENRYHSNLWHW